jgi:hypothetical protein
MNNLLTLRATAILILSAVVSESLAADTPANQTALAKQLIIPRMVMHNATVQEALEFTKTKSQQLDPAKKGVNLLFTNLPESAGNPSWANPPNSDLNAPQEGRVTFDVTNVSVFDAVQRIAKVIKLEVTARKDAIIVHEKGTKP